MACLAK